MQIPLLPNETEEDYRGLYEEMEKHDGRWPGFESFGATRFAAYMAYRMAGIKAPSRTSTWSRPTSRPEFGELEALLESDGPLEPAEVAERRAGC